MLSWSAWKIVWAILKFTAMKRNCSAHSNSSTNSLTSIYSLGGDSYPARVRELLLGLGLAQSELTKPLSVLSGGQKKLIGLARLLLVRPRYFALGRTR